VNAYPRLTALARQLTASPHRHLRRLADWRPTWTHATLGLIMVLAAGLYLVGLERNGYGSAYYAAAVKSMSMNLFNFAYASFDPGGFISIDKPPLGFWFQVLSVRIFGFSGAALFAPQVLASLASVWMLYALVKRSFGAAAALLAALFLALTPVTVVVARSNLVDADLVAFMLASTLAFTYAAVHGSWRWLIAGGLLLGLGFETKMMEAYLIVPALAIGYFAGAPGRRLRRLAQLGLAGLVCLAVSFSWIALVDGTNPINRPYVGSSQTNSALELALGYNGLQRLFGHGFPNPFAPASPAPTGSAKPSPSLAVAPTATPAPLFDGTGSNGKPVAVISRPSDPGPSSTRLFEPYFGGQVGWWLPLAIFGFLAEAAFALSMVRRHTRSRLGPRRLGFLIWGTWLLTVGVFMSLAEFISPYYLSALAPAVAALAAIGLVGGWEAYRRAGLAGWLLPLAIGATASLQALFVVSYLDWFPGLAAPLFFGGWAIAAALALWRWLHRREPDDLDGRLGQGLLVAAVALILVAPSAWTLDSLRPANAGGHPLSGPARSGDEAAALPHADPGILAYLLAHPGPEPFLVATLDADQATGFIFDSGLPVMAMGGFSGSDPVLTPATFANFWVKFHYVRYVVLPSHNLTTKQLHVLYPGVSDPPFARYDGNLAHFIAGSCSPVPPAQWNASVKADSSYSHILADQLFDCANLVSP
jgi:4-amino-4-deoxy-L-arabinose transferase-like glycosyltransferase